MKQEDKIKVLRDAVEEANAKETYGLYKIKNVVVEQNDLDTIDQPLDILEAGYSLNNYKLTAGQLKLFKAYEIDIETGEPIKAKDLETKKLPITRHTPKEQ